MTKDKPKAEDKKLAKTGDHAVTYVPIGEESPMTLTIGFVRRHLTRPTKSGAGPTDSDVIKFLKLCQSRALNPWVGDVCLVGYDDSQLGPVFNLITQIQALEKRAEVNPQFNGIESGVITRKAEGEEILYREGEMVFDGEKLLGGWARVHRKDRDKPFYKDIRLDAYDKNQARWRVDKAGMICKCARAGAYRQAFPTQLGGLYTQDEQATIEAEGELPDMADGKHEFGFRDNVFSDTTESGVEARVNEANGPESLDHEAVDERKTDTPLIGGMGEVVDEHGSVRDVVDEVNAHLREDEESLENQPKAGEPKAADLRFAQLIEHVAQSAEVSLDRAEKVALRWLKRFYPKTSMAFQDQRFDTLIWPKAKKVDWKKEAAA